jgi:hypothetical protein
VIVFDMYVHITTSLNRHRISARVYSVQYQSSQGPQTRASLKNAGNLDVVNPRVATSGPHTWTNP